MNESAQAPGRRVRIGGVDVVVPGSWWRVPLRDRAKREASIKALLKKQFANANAGLTLRHETEQSLLASTAESAHHRGVVLWISTENVYGFPMPMSLLLTELDPFYVRSFDHASEQLASRPDVHTTRMRPGRVLRHTYHHAPGAELTRITGLDAGPSPVPQLTESLQADYWVERPDGRVVQLAFSTPLLRYEKPLLELFETIVDSMSWQDDETPSTSEEEV
jgi:hypothetical protein